MCFVVSYDHLKIYFNGKKLVTYNWNPVYDTEPIGNWGLTLNKVPPETDALEQKALGQDAHLDAIPHSAL